MVMYLQIKPTDRHHFLAEIHPAQPLGEMEGIIPNSAEAEALHTMMQKNLWAFLKFYLVQDAKMDSDFVEALVRASCNPSLSHKAVRCTWDSHTRTLTTRADKEAN